MDITFRFKKYALLAGNKKQCEKELGVVRAKKFLQRIDQLYTAVTLEDVRYLPGHYHELIGDRKGQWACDLDQPYRLIFEPHEKPLPEDENGRTLWIEIKGIEIIEITNYHGK